MPSDNRSTAATWNWMMRHRLELRDAIFVALATLVSVYCVYAVDVFAHHADRVPGIEADELPVIGIVLCIGSLLFAWRRMSEHKREIKLRMDAERKSRELALQDPLTGLSNRRQFNERLAVAIDAPPRAGATHALLLLDLNGFKRVNDVYGHGAGDQLLIILSERLIRSMRDNELVCRLGGDEFAVLAQHLPSAEGAATIAARIVETLAAPVQLAGTMHVVNAGIGIVLFPTETCDAGEVLRRADIALYKAKESKTSTIRFYDEELDRHIKERERLETETRLAIEHGDIEPFFQPLVDLQSKRIIGFEVLSRWQHRELGEIPPDRFITIAEDIGLIDRLSDSLLRRACAIAVTWPGDVLLAFNISPVQLKDMTLGLRILKILGDTGLRADRLEVEITESAMVRDIDAAREVLGGLRQAGVRIALDDFGTGYSNLYHLTHFQVDKIKIDRSFVQQMRNDAGSAAVVGALIGLGHGLGLTVIAEGIESADEDQDLRSKGCEQGQGYLFGKAMPANETLRLFGADESMARLLG